MPAASDRPCELVFAREAWPAGVARRAHRRPRVECAVHRKPAQTRCRTECQALLRAPAHMRSSAAQVRARQADCASARACAQRMDGEAGAGRKAAAVAGGRAGGRVGAAHHHHCRAFARDGRPTGRCEPSRVRAGVRACTAEEQWRLQRAPSASSGRSIERPWQEQRAQRRCAGQRRAGGLCTQAPDACGRTARHWAVGQGPVRASADVPCARWRGWAGGGYAAPSRKMR